MRKTINVQPANEILISFRDKQFLCTFNMRAMTYLNEELYRMEKQADTLCSEHFAAILLYAGIKANHPDYTIDEATALALTVRPVDVNDIISLFNESNGNAVDEELEDSIAKKIIAQVLVNMAKLKSKS